MLGLFSVHKVHHHIELKTTEAKEDSPNTLSTKERILLTKLKNEQITKYRESLEKQFNSEKNYSMLLNPKHNETRNRIMQNLKLEHLKIKVIPDFVRQKKQEIIANRDK